MTFAEQYANHAYADLIREAETQGIGLGVQAERERIIALLEASACDCSGGWTLGCDELLHTGDLPELFALIKGENE